MSSSESDSSGSDLHDTEEQLSDSEDQQSEHSMGESGSSGSDQISAEDSDDSSKPKLTDENFRQMPFEDLLQLKRRLGSKLYNEAVFGKATERKDAPSTDKTRETSKKLKSTQQPQGSDSDGPPEELSARRKVPALGMAKPRGGNPTQNRSRDPRFDAKQGYFSGRKFREQYGFINELRSGELASLQKQLNSTEDPAETKRLKFAIQRTQNQIREFNKQKQQDQKRQEEKLTARKAVDEGKRPFYEKSSVKKAREMVEKFDELKEAGKLGKHIDKRRKKITANDRKKLDFDT